MAGRPPAVSDYEIAVSIARVRSETGDPVVTTSEVAEHLPIKREGLNRRLNDLSEQGLVERKRVGTSYVWWLPHRTETAVRPYVDGTASNPPSEDAVLQKLFSIGQERFDLELGAIARVDPDADRFVVELTSDSVRGFEPGTEFPLSETYCITAATERGPASVADPDAAGLGDITVRRDVGFQTYLGTFLDVRGDDDRTFFFVSSEPRTEPFTEEDHAFHKLLADGAKLELQPPVRSPFPDN